MERVEDDGAWVAVARREVPTEQQRDTQERVDEPEADAAVRDERGHHRRERLGRQHRREGYQPEGHRARERVVVEVGQEVALQNKKTRKTHPPREFRDGSQEFQVCKRGDLGMNPRTAQT